MFQKLKSVLCKLGVHNWKKPVKTSHGFSSNVYDVKKACNNCGKIKRWVEYKR